MSPGTWITHLGRFFGKQPDAPEDNRASFWQARSHGPSLVFFCVISRRVRTLIVDLVAIMRSRRRSLTMDQTSGPEGTRDRVENDRGRTWPKTFKKPMTN